MKSRTNQPVFKDDGTLFDDAQLVSDIQANGGTKLYKHTLNLSEDYVISAAGQTLTFNKIIYYSNNGTPITSQSDINILLAPVEKVTFSGSGDAYIQLIADDILWAFTVSGMVNSRYTLNTISFTDTVTPL